MASNFRSIARWLLPGWLIEGEGGLVNEALTATLDMLAQKVSDGLDAGFPSRADASANALTGLDRGILRGRDETDAHYARRLISWRYPRGHRVRGLAWAALEQVYEYFGGIYCWTVDIRGERFVRTEAGEEQKPGPIAGGWKWFSDPIVTAGKWAQFWLVLEPRPQITFKRWPALDAPGGTWGGGTFDEIAARGVALGHDGITHEDARAICRLFRGRHAWKPAGTKAVFAILGFSDHGSNVIAPDGTWYRYAGAGGRDPSLEYWDLTNDAK